MMKTLIMGLLAGILCGAAGFATAYLIGIKSGLSFPQLSLVSIVLASIVANLVGALIFSKWIRKTGSPRLYYAFLTAIVTILLTINDTMNPPSAKFGEIGHPVHIVVALLSIILIPMWLKQPGIAGETLVAEKNRHHV